MAVTKTQIGIAVGAGVLLVLVFVGYLWWLSNQGPVLARSEDHDPLTGLPVSIRMNPLRDRSTEKAANKFLRELRDGHCDDVLQKCEHDYHRKYAKYICSSEAQHPLLSWQLVEWEEAPPLIILHYPMFFVLFCRVFVFSPCLCAFVVKLLYGRKFASCPAFGCAQPLFVWNHVIF